MMMKNPLFPLALLAMAALAACSTLPPPNARLDEARATLRAVQSDPQTQGLAGSEAKQAADALTAAEAAHAKGEDTTTVDHLAYLSRQRTALLKEAGTRKNAELSVTQANAARDEARLAARTTEADTAQRSAEASQLQAQASQRDAQASQRSAERSQKLVDEADARTAALALQLRELNAKQTERGMVITVGDVLFDTDQSRIKTSGLRGMDKLAEFLKANPQRNALIEGYTDSVGQDDYNQTLSGRRADAVRGALVGMGVSMDRLSTQGFGEAHPVADNDNASGRQMNRRVEIVLSDDNGIIKAR